MFYNISFNVARRVVSFPLVSRSILTRSFSSAPIIAFPARSTVTSQSTKSTTKSATKPKAKSATKTATKKKVAAKPKPKVKKPKKAAVKKPTFTRDELKVPKRPAMSPYITFAAEERRNYASPATIQVAQDQSRELAQKWKALGEDEKEVYRVKAIEQNDQLRKVYHEWLENVDSKILREINARRKAAGKQKIHRLRSEVKGPTPAFLRFFMEYRAQNPSLPTREGTKQAGVAWRALTPEAKKPYLDSFQADRKAHMLEQSARNTSQQSV